MDVGPLSFPFCGFLSSTYWLNVSRNHLEVTRETESDEAGESAIQVAVSKVVNKRSVSWRLFVDWNGIVRFLAPLFFSTSVPNKK